MKPQVLRQQRRRTVRAVLYVSGDGLRVVDADNNRGLLLDQTIEKVRFDYGVFVWEVTFLRI